MASSAPRVRIQVLLAGETQCCLTPRSTGRTTAGQLGPVNSTRYIVAHRAKPARRSAPVNSNVRPRRKTKPSSFTLPDTTPARQKARKPKGAEITQTTSSLQLATPIAEQVSEKFARCTKRSGFKFSVKCASRCLNGQFIKAPQSGADSTRCNRGEAQTQANQFVVAASILRPGAPPAWPNYSLNRTHCGGP